MTKLKCASLLLVGCCLSALPLAAQVVKVDIAPAHATNRFVPKQTLGAGIDRIQTVAIDYSHIRKNPTGHTNSGKICNRERPGFGTQLK